MNIKLKTMFWNESKKHITLKQIHKLESINNKPICMIAVTRKQFNESYFSKYENYVKNILGLPRIYYGLWSDGVNIEHDVYSGHS